MTEDYHIRVTKHLLKEKLPGDTIRLALLLAYNYTLHSNCRLGQFTHQELADEMEISCRSVINHLNTLKDKGIILTTDEGTYLNPKYVYQSNDAVRKANLLKLGVVIPPPEAKRYKFKGVRPAKEGGLEEENYYKNVF